VAALRALSERPLGLRLIIAYKLVKAAAVLGLAVWMTASSGAAWREAQALMRELAEHGGIWHAFAEWLRAHLTETALRTVRVIAWLDGALTALEAALLLTGKSWGEWLVIAGLTALLPFEARSFWLHRRLGRLFVLLANAAIVAYLARRRVLQDLRHRARA
jgi:uncharacterized membrane protein (DUF2068 family)